MVCRKTFIVVSVLLCSTCGLCQDEQQAKQIRLEGLFSRGYTLIPTDPAGASQAFEEILRIDSTNVSAFRQLGSLYITLGKPQTALDRFTRAEMLFPSDTTRLQIAYLLTELGRTDLAVRDFSSLAESPDSSIRDAASTSWVILESDRCRKTYPWWNHVYAAPYYDSRFRDLIFTGSATGGLYFDSARISSAFGVLSISRDTRSTGGEFPAIYADNVVLAGIGIRVEPLMGLSADIQTGLAADLVKRPGEKQVQGDFRAVASYGNGVYPNIRVPQEPHWPFAPFVDFYGSLGYYSRYRNTIGYLQLRGGTRALEFHRMAVDVYLRGDLSGDPGKDFYNDIAEIGAGIRVIPDHLWGLQVLLEYHRGSYWGPFRRDSPYESPYDSVRLFLIFDRSFCL